MQTFCVTAGLNFDVVGEYRRPPCVARVKSTGELILSYFPGALNQTKVSDICDALNDYLDDYEAGENKKADDKAKR
jgi:hypothetical protein